ncbi:MAG: hypothetical protein Kow0027_08490 [Saprospiraceae bacterium]
MKILKPVLIVLGVLIVLTLIVGLIQPTHFSYEKTKLIEAPRQVVFEQVNNLKNWENWGPWDDYDSTLQVTYGEVYEGVGGTYNWTGDPKNSGSGTITLNYSSMDSLCFDLDFGGEGGGIGWFKLEDAEGGGTNTTWGMAFDVPYPFNAFTIFSAGAMEKNIMDMFELGLSDMKKYCESNATPGGNLAVQEIDFPGRTYLTIRKEVNFTEENAISGFLGQSFGAIMQAMGPAGVQMAGHPTGLYYSYDVESGTTDMAAAVPVENGANVSGDGIQVVEIPAGKALLIEYYGDYNGIGAAHEAMDAYIAKNGLTQGTPVIEEYVTDPGQEPDTSKWLTRVYYPIAQ